MMTPGTGLQHARRARAFPARAGYESVLRSLESVLLGDSNSKELGGRVRPEA